MAEKENLYSQLVAAQAEMENAALNKTNPHFRSAYADLASVRAATLPALNKYGLGLVQYFASDGNGGLLLYTRLAHQSGEFLESVYPIAFDKPQAMGSAITYGRRYSWAAICGIAAEEDDDANAAQSTAVKSAYKSRKDGDYPKLEAEIRKQETLEALKQWWIDNQDRIRALPPQWAVMLEGEKDRRKLELADELSGAD